MQRLDISFDKGMRRSPSIAQPGELSECVNLIPEGGELRPAPPMRVIGGFPAEFGGPRVLHVHKNAGYEHYIVAVADEGEVRLYWRKTDSDGNVIPQDDDDLAGNYVALDDDLTFQDIGEIAQVVSQGNTLMVLSHDSADDADEIRYFLWTLRDGEARYRYLGDHIPELDIDFGLKLTLEYGNRIDVVTYHYHDGGHGYFPADERRAVTDAVMAEVNKDIAGCHKAGKFVFPFLVRYALRMYDGTVIHQSPAVLMVPYSRTAPIVRIEEKVGDVLHCEPAYVKADLDYLCGEASKTELAGWSDIITGVEIYSSLPLWTFDQNKLVEGWDEVISYGYCYGADTRAGTVSYKRNNITELKDRNENTHLHDGDVLINLPKREYKIDELDTFYLLSLIPTESIETSERTVVEAGDISNLATRQVMPDGYKSHYRRGARGAFAYNGRLNIYGTGTMYANNIPVGSFFQHTDNTQEREVTISVYIKRGAREYVLNNSALLTNDLHHLSYLYYPDPDAYKVEITNAYSASSLGVRKLVMPLAKSPLLQGAYFFKDFETYADGPFQPSPVPPDESTGYERDGSLLMLSPASNPFVFPLSETYRVGEGEIMRVISNTQALSTGQFGQFPLIAFSTDGVWALEVRGDGTYYPAKPISRDVCVNAESVTQTDNAVVFVTSQGLMVSNGSDIALLSDKLNGANVDEDVFFPPALKGLLPAWSGLFVRDMDEIRAVLAHPGLRIGWDYPHRLLHIYPNYDEEQGQVSHKHLVMSMVNREFSTVIDTGMPTVIVPYWPLSVVQVGRVLYDYGVGEPVSDGLVRRGFALTRPLELQDPFARKLLYDLRAYFSRTEVTTGTGTTGMSGVRVQIYCSNDNAHWKMLGSLKGHSYKYYRFAIFTEFTDLDALSGMTVLYDRRLADKLR